MPFGYHLATVDVFEDGDGTFLVYSCEVEPDDAKAHHGPRLRRPRRGPEGPRRGLTRPVR